MGGEAEKFKWFLACLLFGRPIQQTVARRAYEEFAREGLVSPDAILGASASERGIARRLQEFKGIGPVTARVFLRGLREAGTKLRQR